MEDIHNFIGGLHSDFDEQNQPKNTYREAYNWIRLEDGSLVNEKGTQRILSFPVENIIVGMHPLGEEVIVFSYGIDTDFQQYGEIGIVNSNGNYTTKISHNSINLQNKKIKAESRVDYRGHRIVYFWDINGELPIRRVDLDDTYSGSNLEEATRLFLNTDLPDIKVTSITDDGNLPTGIYQFSARLLTSSLNKSAASLITNIVPISNESTSGGTEQYDGALPQTPSFKAINLEITNIDTKYKFIEIICTTYEGLTNTPKSNVIATKTITSTTMSHKYSSLEENGEEITLDELTIEPLALDYPKSGTQKDGHLILGNLQAKRYDTNFQTVANNCVIRYAIKEFDYTENININGSYSSANTGYGLDLGSSTSQFNNYKSELSTTDFRGYRRDEVYSFAIVPIFKNGTYGNAYHIPGDYNPFNIGGFGGRTGPFPADTITKKLGYLKCQDELYPDGYGYPTGNVCYHKMPTIQQEPIFSNGKIRVLGIKVEYNLSLLTQEERDNIMGIAIVRELRTEANKSILAQGIVNQMYTLLNGDKILAPWSGKMHWQHTGNTTYYNQDMVGFLSPETTIYKDNVFGATNLVSIGTMYGDSKLVADKLASGDNQRFAHFFLNYNTLYPHSPTSTTLNKNYTKYINANSGVHDIQGTKVDSFATNGYVLLKGTSAFRIYENDSTKDLTGGLGEISYRPLSGTDEIWMYNQDGNVYNTTSGRTRRNLYNLVVNRPNQYGSPLDKEYILVSYKRLDTNNYIECYGGDTFINKTSIVSTTKLVNNKTTLSIDLDARTLNYFFCESSINTAYRHHYTDSNNVAHTVDYYPHRRRIFTHEGDGLLQILPEYGHANGYNKQYSFENTLKKFYSKSIFTEEEVTRFENRVIYSEQSIEGEQFDAYRLFLVNNYHDVPKNKGEITNLFIHQDNLYIHTSQSLWKSSFNERVTQTSSAGEVVLGNGGKFSRPSLEMFPQQGGYAGSIDPLATCNSPYGTFIVDRLQSRVFLLGSSFEDITTGLTKKFREKLVKLSSAVSTFDYKNDRWILCIKDLEFDYDLTLSYFPKLKSFSSYHSYFPTSITSVNQKVFLSEHSYLGELGKGNYATHPDVYYDEDEEETIIDESTYESSIRISSNDNPLITKVFDNAIINSNLAFTRLLVWKKTTFNNKWLIEDDSWDFEPRSGEQRITKKNDEYRLAIPLDTDSKRYKRKALELEFTYRNEDNLEFTVKYITIKYRANAR